MKRPEGCFEALDHPAASLDRRRRATRTAGTFRVKVTEGHRHDRWDVRVETEAQSIQRQQCDREHEARREDRECESRVLAHLSAQPRCRRQFHGPGTRPETLKPLLPSSA